MEDNTEWASFASYYCDHMDDEDNVFEKTKQTYDMFKVVTVTTKKIMADEEFDSITREVVRDVMLILKGFEPFGVFDDSDRVTDNEYKLYTDIIKQYIMDQNLFVIHLFVEFVSKGLDGVVKHFLEDPLFNVNDCSSKHYHQNALHIAASKGYDNIVKMILQHPKCDPSLLSPTNLSAVDYAVCKIVPHPSTLAILLDDPLTHDTVLKKGGEGIPTLFYIVTGIHEASRASVMNAHDSKSFIEHLMLNKIRHELNRQLLAQYIIAAHNHPETLQFDTLRSSLMAHFIKMNMNAVNELYALQKYGLSNQVLNALLQ